MIPSKPDAEFIGRLPHSPVLPERILPPNVSKWRCPGCDGWINSLRAMDSGAMKDANANLCRCFVRGRRRPMSRGQVVHEQQVHALAARPLLAWVVVVVVSVASTTADIIVVHAAAAITGTRSTIGPRCAVFRAGEKRVNRVQQRPHLRLPEQLVSAFDKWPRAGMHGVEISER